MSNFDYTLTSPIFQPASDANPLLVLTIVWHPELHRIGEQFLGTTEEGLIELSRYSPLFKSPQIDALPVGYSGISRNPVSIIRHTNNTITIMPPVSRMVVEVNGEQITQSTNFSKELVENGLILGLGRAVIFCLHWMRCLPKQNPVQGLIGVGESAIRTRDLIKQAAKTNSTVLLLGETGTGKEVVAQAIHALSDHSNKKMTSINMATLNESLAAADLFGATKGAYTGAQTSRTGLFSEAQDSSLFLDEIGNTPANIQPMLLRVIESGEYRPLGAQKDSHSNARLITATDQNLNEDHFNQALLRRLESFIIKLPPLRARREDIGVLIVYILENRTESLADIDPNSIPNHLITQLLTYHWPGNVRQLNHVLNRILLSFQNGETPSLHTLIDLSPEGKDQQLENFLPPSTTTPESEIPPIKHHEKHSASERVKLTELSDIDVLNAMEKNFWTIQYAAQDLGISRPSMYKLLEANSLIRRPEQIGVEELTQAIAQCKGEIEPCASLLKTPSEALRRHLKGLRLIS